MELDRDTRRLLRRHTKPTLTGSEIRGLSRTRNGKYALGALGVGALLMLAFPDEKTSLKPQRPPK